MSFSNSSSSSTATKDHDRRGVSWFVRRVTAPAAALLVGGTLAVAPAAVPVADTAADPGVLTPSSIEFLDGESHHGAVTLSNLRSDVLGNSAAMSLGQGVDVAIIDTGVAPVDGLRGPDKLIHGPDLSFEAGSPAANLDTYGHGTHLAGIVAGERAGAPGIAPGARLVSIKVAGHDGVTTVPQVVSAIDWVVDNRNADGLNIRVLNLSLGQAGVTTNAGDPLSAAVERAWDAGIVVVVAAGNDGSTQSHLDSPAISPFVIAVGAVDSNSGGDDRDERRVPGWSGKGDSTRKPDLVAPGRSIASYRVPGSTVDDDAPAGRYGDDLFLGSGTSQAAAVTSGVAAALLGTNPDLTPDQVKATLEDRAFRLDDVSSRKQGDGHIGRSSVSQPSRPSTAQNHGRATDGNHGLSRPAQSTWSGGTWSGGTWSGGTWSGAGWSGTSWSGGTWSGGTWSGGTWSGGTWSGGTWSGDGWE